MTKHGSWAPAVTDDQIVPSMLNIDEIAGGCGNITDALTVAGWRPILPVWDIGAWSSACCRHARDQRAAGVQARGG